MNLPEPPPVSEKTTKHLHETLLAFPQQFKQEIQKVIVGQEPILDLMLTALLCNGHVLLTGVPGLAKTLLVKTVASVFQLSYNRVQCTPDLMPSDITGVEILEEAAQGQERNFRFVQGPLFTHLLLADEINRTSPRTQAALLQAMQEKQVTMVGKTYSLQAPFIVFATQNPIDSEGTYLLPEAQLDRFLFNLSIDYPTLEEEIAIAAQLPLNGSSTLQPILDRSYLLEFQKLVQAFPMPESLVTWIVHFVRATRPKESTQEVVNRFVEWGAGVRASQYIVLAAKAKALLSGKNVTTSKDVEAVLFPILRHRILINFVGEAEGWESERIIRLLLETQPYRP